MIIEDRAGNYGRMKTFFEKNIEKFNSIFGFFTNSILFILLICFISSIYELRGDSKWHSGVIRIQSNISCGTESLEQIALKARALGLDYVVFSDQFNVRVEYGMLPLRNLLKIFKTRKSIRTFGIGKYFDAISDMNAKYSDIVLIPGADIAPFYNWDGGFLSGDLKCKRFSEQLTIMSPDPTEVCQKLPVIHNDEYIFSKFDFIKLSPLFFVIWGVYMIRFRKLGVTQRYDSPTTRIVSQRVAVGVILVAVGLSWTLNNRPFVNTFPFDQYHDYGVLPYSNLANYIEHNKAHGNIAAFWSAPGAAMNVKLLGVDLVTEPYWNDVLDVDGYDGFAALYGDALTAHLPGNYWDVMLTEYISGKRNAKPVIIGEVDYHGRKRRLDVIKTMVYTDELSVNSIIHALKKGNSYGYFQDGAYEIYLNEIFLSSNEGKFTKSIPGDWISSKTNNLNLKISGNITSRKSEKVIFPRKTPEFKPLEITVIMNGEIVYRKKLLRKQFDLDIPITVAKNLQKGYIRVMMQSPSVGLLLVNPFFYKSLVKL